MPAASPFSPRSSWPSSSVGAWLTQHTFGNVRQFDRAGEAPQAFPIRPIIAFLAAKDRPRSNDTTRAADRSVTPGSARSLRRLSPA